MKKLLIIALLTTCIAAPAIASRAKYKATAIDFYRSARGDNSVRVRITSKTWKNISIRSSKLCAKSQNNETVCGNGRGYIDLKSGQSILIDLGRTQYPLTRVYIRE